MTKFKQFMNLQNFDDLSRKAMRTHMKKPEVVEIMRALAVKHADSGKMDKALNYLERAFTLAD